MPPPILLYDGTCAYCSRWVQFVLDHEGRRDDLRFGHLSGAVGRELFARRPDLAGADTVFWVEPAADGHAEVVRLRTGVTLALFRYLGGGWSAVAALLWLVPRPIRDWGYDLVARRRHQLVRGEACVVPSAAQRARFLDPA